MIFEHICTKITILFDVWYLSISAQKSQFCLIEHICTKIWILFDIWHLSIFVLKSRLNCFRGTARFIFWRANILHFINTSCFSNKCTSFKTQVGPKHVSIIYFILFQKRSSIEQRVLPSFIPYYPVSWVQKPIVHCFFYVCDKLGEESLKGCYSATSPKLTNLLNYSQHKLMVGQWSF